MVLDDWSCYIALSVPNLSRVIVILISGLSVNCNVIRRLASVVSKLQLYRGGKFLWHTDTNEVCRLPPC